MKTPTSKTAVLTALATFAGVAFTGVVSAQVVYQDGFSYTGSVTGMAPDTTDTNGAVWSNTQGNFTSNGMLATVTSNLANEFLPANVANVNLSAGFTLSLDVSNPNGTSAIGLELSTDQYNGGSQTAGDGSETDLLAVIGNADGNINDLSQGTYVNNHYGQGATGTVSLTYDSTAGTLKYIFNSTTLDTITVTPAQIAALSDVGMFVSYNNYNSGNSSFPTDDNFTLTLAGGSGVPEPSTYALMLGGLGGLLLILRHHRRVS